MQHQLAPLTLPVGVDEHRRLRRVPIPEIVRRELVVPLQPPRRAIQREDRIGIQVVSPAVIAVVLLAGVPRGPVDRVELRIVAAGEPRGRAAVLDVLALPGLRSRLARLRHRAESPDLLARRLVVRRDESVRAVFTAGHARDDQIACRKRRGRGGVILAPVAELRVPQQLARETVERDDVRVVRLHEHAIARDGNAAVRAAAGGQVRRARPPVVPDPPAAPGIEREAFVDPRHVHDPARDGRRDLQVTCVREREHPRHREPADGVPVDLRQRRVAVPAGIAVVGGPIRSGGHFAEAIVGAAQQVHAAVIGAHLHVLESFAEHLCVEDRSGGGCDLHARSGRGLFAAFNRAEKLQQARHLGWLDEAGRHPLLGPPLADEGRELPVVARRQTRQDRRPSLASLPVSPVAGPAIRLERLAPRIGVLREEPRDRKRQYGSDQANPVNRFRHSAFSIRHSVRSCRIA